MYPSRLPRFIFLLSFLAFVDRSACAAEKQEETYSISLVQSAETDKEVREVDGRKVLTEKYRVRPGDTLWGILRQKEVNKRQNLREVLDTLKRLNPKLKNIDLLHPGETLVIPLLVTPPQTEGAPAPVKTAEPPVPLEKLQDVKLELYTIQPGDNLIRVIKSKYNLSDADIHDEYINLLKRFNPELGSLQLVRPGQKVRLPIYTPQVVRMPLPPPPPPSREESPPVRIQEETPPTPAPDVSALTAQLSGVMKEMGLEWVDAGQHFIPLKSGGQVTLNADIFPILNMPSGARVIVDCTGGLPQKMAGLITASWENYRIVRIGPKDSLGEAMGKILPACGFPKLYRSSEPLELPGEVALRLTADWIVQTPAGDRDGGRRYISLTLMDAGAERISAPLRDLLESRGVRVVEYPPEKSAPPALSPQANPARMGGGVREVVGEMLRIAGIPYSRDSEIPVFQGGKTPFNLVVKADFLFSKEGAEKIVDFEGMGPEVLSLLREHQFKVLSISERMGAMDAVASVLDFVGVPFDAHPHTFPAAERSGARNLFLTVGGITFSPADGKVLVSPVPLPEAVSGFLASKGYKTLEVSP